MEYITRNGIAREVVARYKAIRDEVTGDIKAVPLKAVYRCIGGVAVLVWELVRSCFGSGGWNNDSPWVNDDGWKN